MKLSKKTKKIGIIAFLMLLIPVNLYAIQAHGGSEGIVVHQMGHVFFLLSMAVFIYWLRKGKIISDEGWRYIFWFAVFMGIWNLDVIFMHFLDEQEMIVNAVRTETWKVAIQSRYGSPFIPVMYYLGKLDHLICVPALFFLYLGLRRILSELNSVKSGKGDA